MDGFDGTGVTAELVSDVYRYLLARFLVVRQEQSDRRGDGFAYNRVIRNPLGSAEFVNPNLDVAYLEAWVAVDAEHPVVLEVPRIDGRYYTAQLIDEWGEVIANINDRVTPLTPYGRFALVAPGSAAPTPEGTTRLELHGRKAKLLARIELKDDPAGAVELQHGFTLDASPGIEVVEPPAVPEFDNDTLLGAEIFELADVVLASALDVSPDAAGWQLAARTIGAMIAGRPERRERLGAELRERIVPEFKRWAVTEAAPYVDHWIGGARLGNYGGDVALRTMVDYIGIWGNTSTEVVYFVATRDADDVVLDGSAHYRLRFPADRLPDTAVDAYWSVILVSVPDYRVVPNELDRYNLNQYSPLARDADGALTLTIGPDRAAAEPESNWLPTAAGTAFSLTFRCYVPRRSRPFGDWGPPAVERLD